MVKNLFLKCFGSKVNHHDLQNIQILISLKINISEYSTFIKLYKPSIFTQFNQKE